jgi:hypothetical protein
LWKQPLGNPVQREFQSPVAPACGLHPGTQKHRPPCAATSVRILAGYGMSLLERKADIRRDLDSCIAANCASDQSVPERFAQPKKITVTLRSISWALILIKPDVSNSPKKC